MPKALGPGGLGGCLRLECDKHGETKQEKKMVD